MKRAPALSFHCYYYCVGNLSDLLYASRKMLPN